jgi:hypothetical protein
MITCYLLLFPFPLQSSARGVLAMVKKALESLATSSATSDAPKASACNELIATIDAEIAAGALSHTYPAGYTFSLADKSLVGLYTDKLGDPEVRVFKHAFNAAFGKIAPTAAAESSSSSSSGGAGAATEAEDPDKRDTKSCFPSSNPLKAPTAHNGMIDVWQALADVDATLLRMTELQADLGMSLEQVKGAVGEATGAISSSSSSSSSDGGVTTIGFGSSSSSSGGLISSSSSEAAPTSAAAAPLLLSSLTASSASAASAGAGAGAGAVAAAPMMVVRKKVALAPVPVAAPAAPTALPTAPTVAVEDSTTAISGNKRKFGEVEMEGEGEGEAEGEKAVAEPEAKRQAKEEEQEA